MDIKNRKLQAGDIADEEMIRKTTEYEDEIEGRTLIQSMSADAYIGSLRLFHTFSRGSKDEAFFYDGMCEEGDNVNRSPWTARLVFIASAYKAETKEEFIFNRKLARALAWSSYNAGELPILPHLYFPDFASDTGQNRVWGFEAGHMLMTQCNALRVAVVDGHISWGMRLDIDFGISIGLQPEYISLTREATQKMIDIFEEGQDEEWRDGK